MKPSKVILKTLVALLVAIATLLILASCDCSGCEGEESTSQSTLPPDGQITLTSICFSDDMPVKFKAIRAYSASSKLSGEAADFIALIEANTGAQIEISNDHDAATDGTFEILIGGTNRSESREAASELDENEYRICVMGYKLVAVGGSEEALIEGLDRFAQNYVKGKMIVDLPLDFSMQGSISLK